MVERGLEQGAAQLLETLVQRIPVVRTVYDVVQKLVGLLSRKDGEELQSLSPCGCTSAANRATAPMTP